MGIKFLRLFVKAPVRDIPEKVVLLNVWLKRITPPEPESGMPQYMLPSQVAAVDGFAWVEDTDNITSGMFSMLLSTVDPKAWQPSLRLETEAGEAIHSVPIHTQLDHPWSHLRPFHFSFPLGTSDLGRCFKVWEASFHDYKVPLCLPPSSASLCHRLAPSPRYTPSNPALWSALIPFRSMDTPWKQHIERTANRLHHHLTYLQHIGGAGALLFIDPLTSQALERSPLIQRFLREGVLVFVSWDQMERHTYDYDHVWTYTAAVLGLSSCGTNVWVQLLDLDETLYNVHGKTWPAMYRCLVESAGEAAGVFRVRRVDVLPSTLAPAREAELWYAPPARGDGTHPFEAYDRIAKTPFNVYNGKCIACPARRIVDVWVHNATPLGGTWHEGNASCAFALHVVNFWRERVTGDSVTFEPFKLLSGRS